MDAANLAYISTEIIDEALSFINVHLGDGQIVLVHCNQGMSQSPGIGLLYLAKEEVLSNDSFQAALIEFRTIYPGY
ncbi:MAG: hypothetical protein WED10_06050 [Brumimicrobium sp.]